MLDRLPLVLIVNDDDALGAALQFVLRLERIEVRVYRDGPHMLADNDLGRAGCLIITDWMLPMDGFEILDCLRTRGIEIPVILLTSHATTVLRARATAAGVRLVLEKPILDNAVVDGVFNLLGSQIIT
jgi:two-component system response regulator FixJ